MPRPALAPAIVDRGLATRRWALSEWSLLALRLFLGGTFVDAGLQKLTNPAFFAAKSPASVQAQMAGAARRSPIHSFRHATLTHAVLIGWVIAYGELAIAVGSLLGLKTRVAAVAGVLVSLSLFSAVSFHSSPSFTGADIVFLFAWVLLNVAGDGSRWSIDAFIARRAAQQAGFTLAPLVALPLDAGAATLWFLPRGTVLRACGRVPCSCRDRRRSLR